MLLGLDLVFAIAGFVVVCALMAWAAFPFNAVLSLAVGLFIAHFATMFQSLRNGALIAFTDHLLTYLILFTWLTWNHTLLFAPGLLAFVYLFFRPGLRSRFHRKPHRLVDPGLPEGILILILTPLACLAHLGVNGDFPILGQGTGLLVVFTTLTGRVTLLITAVATVIMALARWRAAFFLAPLVVILLQFPWFPLSILPGALFLALWQVEEVARHFGFEGPGQPRRLFCTVLWIALLGWGFSLLPVGICAVHHWPMYLYQAWESPLIRGQVAGKTAYSEFQTVDFAHHVRMNCPKCEFAHVYRVELAVCRKQRTALVASFTATLPRPLASFGPFTLENRPQGLAILEGSLPDLPPLTNASFPSACPLAARLKIPARPYTLRHATGAAELTTSCPTCDDHGI